MVVVQGLITDQPGPYVISISKTIPIEVQSQVTARIAGATVKITDSNGYSEYLIEKSPGKFYTQNIQGAVGTSYFITVTTNDSSVYESTVEKMLPVNDFSLQSEFVMNEDSLDQRIDSTSHTGLQCTLRPMGFNVICENWFFAGARGVGFGGEVSVPGRSRLDLGLLKRNKWTCWCSLITVQASGAPYVHVATAGSPE